jgi:hypothetical protein
MSEKRIEAYIQKRLAELETGKDLQDVVNKGRFSFGMDSGSYGHLPAWKELLLKKKQMVRMTWLNAFFVSLMAVGIAGDYFEKFGENWIKTLLTLICVAVVCMLFYTIIGFYSQFYHFRQTERVVRKLIYQDILSQLKKEEKELV